MEKVKENFKRRKREYNKFANSKVEEFIICLSKTILCVSGQGGKIMVCGNGGSAAESSHFVTELIVRYKNKRKSIAAVSLCGDSSVITAASNDFKFDDVFSKQIEGLGKNKDILVAISTSGQSKNITKALKTAKKKGIVTFSMLGNDGGTAKKYSDFYYIDRCSDTAIIQEHQLVIIHLICELIDNEINE